jgi:hypothetical protein
MAATIKIKNSSTASAVPTSSDLVQGELAVNVTDKRVFTENASGTVVELGTNPSSITLPAGSASAPTLLASGDTNTGLFFPAADTVGITTGGTERARVDSSGNFGIGTPPSTWVSSLKAQQIGGSLSLWGTSSGSNNAGIESNSYVNTSGNSIYISSTYATRYQQYIGQHIWYNAASGTAGNAITFTQAMTLDASGNLGVGTSSPSGRLHVSGQTRIADSSNAANYILIGSGANAPRGGNALTAQTGSLVFATETANPMIFVTNATEAARIDSSGNLLVGTTSTSQSSGVGAKLFSTGNVWIVSPSGDAFSYYNSTASAYRFYVNQSGTISATSTTISAISDIRFKENVRDLNVGLAEVMALKPRLYDWKEGKGADIKNARGFIAQEFEEVFPDLIDEWRDPAPEGEEPYKSVRADLIPVLVKAIQELKAIVDAQAVEIAALKG